MGLLAVVVYLYTVLAFNFFRKFYNKSEDKDTRDMKCNDMLTVRKNLNFSYTHTHPPTERLSSWAVLISAANSATHLVPSCSD